MARLFDDGSSEYLLYSGAVLSSTPLAMACWFRSDDTTIDQNLISICDTDTLHTFYLSAMGAESGDPLWARTGDSGFGEAVSTAGYSANTWHHACGIFASATNRRVLLDNANKDTDTTSHTPANLDNTAIGSVLFNSSQYTPMSGRIAEVGLWDLTNWPGATDSDKADEFERQALPALADGFSPLFFPLGLTAYWPLGGCAAGDNSGNAANSDLDIVGKYHMDPQNTPSVADHPAIIYPIQGLTTGVGIIVGTTTWGHDTGVTETNIRNFAGNWTGTGTVSGSGDAEIISLDAKKWMASEVVNTGAQTVRLRQNVYDGTGDDVTINYRTGATPTACKAAAWTAYSAPFASSGYVQVQLVSTTPPSNTPSHTASHTVSHTPSHTASST